MHFSVNSFQAAFYVIFVLLLSYSLLYGSTKVDPIQYRGVADLLRGLCEVVTLLAVFFLHLRRNQSNENVSKTTSKQWQNIIIDL